MTSAVIFDLDGTLIDSAPDIVAAVNRDLSARGWPEQEVAFVEQFIGYGSRKLLVDLFTEIGHPTDEQTLARAHQSYLDNYRAAPAEQTRFFPHVREDLTALSRAGVRLGLCTNKPHDMTRRVLDVLGLASLFEVAIGADAVPACKPDPGHLWAVTEQMGLGRGDFVYVGDTQVDQMTARAADVPFFAVPWGAGGLLDVAPHQRLSRLSDLCNSGILARVLG